MVDTNVSNSYILTIEDFEARLNGDPRTLAIALKAAASDVQTWYLQRATKSLDALPLKGQTYYEYNPNTTLESDEQALMFPRVIDGKVCDWDEDIDGPIVPAAVKNACVEEAIALYEFYSSSSDQKRRKLQSQGVQSFSIGKLSESYVPTAVNKFKGLRSEDAYKQMKPYILGAAEIVWSNNTFRTDSPVFSR
jgi:hypothetical protein